MSARGLQRALNWTLFRSWHGAIALAVLGGTLAALYWTGATPGRGPGSQRGFLLTTGWVAFGLFAIVMAYVVRKHMHARGYSPEFWMRPALEGDEKKRTPKQKVAVRQERAVRREEAAELRLNELRAQIRLGALREQKEIQRRADDILASEGAARLFRVDVVPEGGSFALLTRPTEPLGRLARWLHAHLYYGLAAMAVVGLHGGLVPTTPMAWLLELGTVLVVLTGLWGIATWTRGPSWMTAKERELGLTIEMAHALDFSLRLSLQGALDEVAEGTRVELSRLSSSPASRFPEALASARQELESETDETKKRAVGDALILIGQVWHVRGRLKQLQFVRWTFQGWRGLHVPLAWFFLGVIGLHVLAVWWY